MKDSIKIIFFIYLLLMLLILPLTLFSQASDRNYSTLTFSMSPRYELPLFTDSTRFGNGLSGDFTISYKPPIAFPIHVSLNLGYTYLPLKLSWANPIHNILAGVGVGVDFRFLGRIAADLYVRGGYYEGILENLKGEIIYGGNPYIDAGGGLSFYLSPRLRMGMGSSYRQLFGKPDDFLRSVGFYVGTSYRIPLSGSIDIAPAETKPARLRILKVNFDDIFPVFYKYYDDHPIGKITVENGEESKIDDIKVSFYIKQYMDNPKTYRVEGPIERGEKRDIDLFALFNERVLTITEGAKVSSELVIDYRIKGLEKRKTMISTVSIQNRNASIWDDDRRAAAFVTARDPLVLKLGKNLAGVIRNQPVGVLGKNLMLTLAIHNALSMYGMTYIVDPNTPYREFHEKKQAIDFLQFPRQTLEYKAGDCDDLSILYAALLEALSINTAFITAPGHIYIAVDLGMTPSQANAIFYNTDDLIIRNGKVWFPFEVTMVQEDFIKAWQEGAREWRKYTPLGKTGFYPVSEAWKVFEPVGLPGETPGIEFPPMEKVKVAFTADIKRVIEKEIVNKVKDLESRIAKSGNNPRLINKLGILYARYGLYDKAEKQFLKIMEKSGYRGIALVNVGNIRYKKGDYKGALRYYEKARVALADDPKVLLNIARARYQLGNYEQSRKLYDRVKLISPALVKGYEYLGTGSKSSSRAASAEERGSVLWQE